MANGEAIPVRFQKHLDRLMPSYRKKDSADPHFPVRPRGSWTRRAAFGEYRHVSRRQRASGWND